jgi:hypothetical protein
MSSTACGGAATRSRPGSAKATQTAYARKAIDMLCERGMLTRKRGSGTYITPKLEQPLSRLTSFSEELRERGFTAGSRWLQRDIGIASPVELLSLGPVAEHAGGAPEAPAHRRRRGDGD